MSKKCQITGKKVTRGFTYAIRGIAKKKKGIGLKVTGKTKRTFLPNLMKKRFWLDEEKRFVTLKVSKAGIKIIDRDGVGAVVKKMRHSGVAV